MPSPPPSRKKRPKSPPELQRSLPDRARSLQVYPKSETELSKIAPRPPRDRPRQARDNFKMPPDVSEWFSDRLKSARAGRYFLGGYHRPRGSGGSKSREKSVNCAFAACTVCPYARTSCSHMLDIAQHCASLVIGLRLCASMWGINIE